MATVMLSYSVPEEECELRAAQEGEQTRNALRDLSEWLRSQLKYHDLTDPESQAYGALREKFYEVLAEWSIDLDA